MIEGAHQRLASLLWLHAALLNGFHQRLQAFFQQLLATFRPQTPVFQVPLVVCPKGCHPIDVGQLAPRFHLDVSLFQECFQCLVCLLKLFLHIGQAVGSHRLEQRILRFLVVGLMTQAEVFQQCHKRLLLLQQVGYAGKTCPWRVGLEEFHVLALGEEAGQEPLPGYLFPLCLQLFRILADKRLRVLCRQFAQCFVHIAHPSHIAVGQVGRNGQCALRLRQALVGLSVGRHALRQLFEGACARCLRIESGQRMAGRMTRHLEHSLQSINIFRPLLQLLFRHAVYGRQTAFYLIALDREVS